MGIGQSRKTERMTEQEMASFLYDLYNRDPVRADLSSEELPAYDAEKLREREAILQAEADRLRQIEAERVKQVEDALRAEVERARQMELALQAQRQAEAEQAELYLQAQRQAEAEQIARAIALTNETQAIFDKQLTQEYILKSATEQTLRDQELLAGGAATLAEAEEARLRLLANAQAVEQTRLLEEQETIKKTALESAALKAQNELMSIQTEQKKILVKQQGNEIFEFRKNIYSFEERLKNEIAGLNEADTIKKLDAFAVETKKAAEMMELQHKQQRENLAVQQQKDRDDLQSTISGITDEQLAEINKEVQIQSELSVKIKSDAAAFSQMIDDAKQKNKSKYFMYLMLILIFLLLILVSLSVSYFYFEYNPFTAGSAPRRSL